MPGKCVFIGKKMIEFWHEKTSHNILHFGPDSSIRIIRRNGFQILNDEARFFLWHHKYKYTFGEFFEDLVMDEFPHLRKFRKLA